MEFPVAFGKFLGFASGEFVLGGYVADGTVKPHGVVMPEIACDGVFGLELLSNVVDWGDQAAMFLTPFTNVTPAKTSGSIAHRGAISDEMPAPFLHVGRYF